MFSVYVFFQAVGSFGYVVAAGAMQVLLEVVLSYLEFYVVNCVHLVPESEVVVVPDPFDDVRARDGPVYS